MDKFSNEMMLTTRLCTMALVLLLDACFSRRDLRKRVRKPACPSLILTFDLTAQSAVSAIATLLVSFEYCVGPSYSSWLLNSIPSRRLNLIDSLALSSIGS